MKGDLVILLFPPTTEVGYKIFGFVGMVGVFKVIVKRIVHKTETF